MGKVGKEQVVDVINLIKSELLNESLLLLAPYLI